MTDEEIRRAAHAAATFLFTTYRGDLATRLVSVTEAPGVTAKVIDARDNGGYCLEAVRDAIENAIREAAGRGNASTP